MKQCTVTILYNCNIYFALKGPFVIFSHLGDSNEILTSLVLEAEHSSVEVRYASWVDKKLTGLSQLKAKLISGPEKVKP